MRIGRSLVVLGAAWMGIVTTTPARAEKERIAVLMLGVSPQETEIADNVTEVIIARIAGTSRAEISGTPEFHRRLGLETPSQAGSCLQDRDCLRRVAVSLGVTRIVTGSVGQRGQKFTFNLVLHDIPNERVLQRVFHLVDGSVDDLVRAVQAATDELFVASPSPGRIRVTSSMPAARVSIDDVYVGATPVLSGELLPGKHGVRVEKTGHFPWSSEVSVPSAATVGIDLTPANFPERKRVPTVVAYGGGIASLFCLLSGATLGFVAQSEPSAVNRAEAQHDFERRLSLGTAADALLVSGAVLALTSALTFWLYRDHIFETEHAGR